MLNKHITGLSGCKEKSAKIPREFAEIPMGGGKRPRFPVEKTRQTAGMPLRRTETGPAGVNFL